MPLLVFDATQSVIAMGRVTAIGVVGQLVTALVSGQVVDRVNRRHLMIACDLARAVLFGMPVFAAFHVLTLPSIYCVAALAAVASNFFYVACDPPDKYRRPRPPAAVASRHPRRFIMSWRALGARNAAIDSAATEPSSRFALRAAELDDGMF